MNINQVINKNEASKLTISVLQRFEQSITSYEKGDKEGVIQRLKEMKPDTVLLEQVSNKFRDDLQMDANHYQRLSERLLIIIQDVKKNQDKLIYLIEKNTSKIAISNEMIKVDKKQIADFNAEIECLKSEIKEINERYDETAKWFWVPGYGQYLAGRALVDTIEGKIGRTDDIKKNIQALIKENNKTEKEIHARKLSLSSLSANMQEIKEEKKVLEQQKQELQIQNKIYAGRITSVMDMAFYYRKLNTVLDGMNDALDSLNPVRKVFSRLNEIITFYSPEGKAYDITFKESLLKLGKEMDNYRPVNGDSVRRVNFGFKEKQIGSFIQTDKKEWSEYSEEKDKNIFKFNEVNRDEWSVYLYDVSRSISIQLDLWKNKVYFNDKNTTCKELYQILSTSEKVTGWTAVTVDYGTLAEKAGSFVEVSRKKWSEVSEKQGKITFSFNETHRDEWSVYLHDISRDVFLQIDLWKNKVYYSDKNTSRSELYTIIGAS